MAEKVLAFRHSGKLGDIVYSLPTIRAHGGGILYLNADGRYEMGPDQANSLISLLSLQEYLREVKLWEGEPFDIDLDVFRCFDPLHTNLADVHLRAFGLPSSLRDEQWLILPRNRQRKKAPEVVFSRTSLRPGPHGMWEQVYALVGSRAVFVGTDAEHEDFVGRYGNVRRVVVDDLLGIAKLIEGAKLFVGNQSCPYAIAEGLKKPIILEVDATQPNCIFNRVDALAVQRVEDIDSILGHVQRFVDGVSGESARAVAIKPSAERVGLAPVGSAFEPSPSPGATGYYDGANLRLIARVPEDARRILDVGCAAGRLGEALKIENPAREIWGIEAVPEIARSARNRLDQVLVGDIERMDPLPIPERYFDCMLFGDVLEHMRRPEDVLARLRKHLAPGGKILCSVPNVAHWSVLVQLLQGEFRYEKNGLLDRTHLTFFTPRSFKRMLWDAGYFVHGEEPFDLPDECVMQALQQAAAELGLDPKMTETATANYQTVFEAQSQPNPYEDPDKMAILLGPHVGNLGPAKGKRCSIILLTYNSEKTLDECLGSVIPTLGPDDELICIDNASQDRTQEMLTEYANSCSAIKLIFNEENFGFSTGSNIGMLASSGEYIVLLNPDTRVWQNWIEKLLNRFSVGDVGAVGPLSDRVSGDQFVRFHMPKGAGPANLDDLAAFLNKLNGNKCAETKLLVGFCIAFARSTLDKFGLLVDEMFLGSDDLEISWRLRVLGFRLLIAPDNLVHHETGASQLSMEYAKRAALSHESAKILQEKLKRYYGSSVSIDSYLLWGNSIFPLQ